MGFVHRVFGHANVAENKKEIGMLIVFCTILLNVYLYVNTALFNLHDMQIKTVNKIVSEIAISKEVS